MLGMDNNKSLHKYMVEMEVLGTGSQLREHPGIAHCQAQIHHQIHTRSTLDANSVLRAEMSIADRHALWRILHCRRMQGQDTWNVADTLCYESHSCEEQNNLLVADKHRLTDTHSVIDAYSMAANTA